MTILACDLGGTRLKIGLVQDYRVLAQTTEPANSKQGLAPQLPALKTAWLRLLDGLKLHPCDCAGISMAFASLVDGATGRVLAEYGKFADAPGSICALGRGRNSVCRWPSRTMPAWH